MSHTGEQQGWHVVSKMSSFICMFHPSSACTILRQHSPPYICISYSAFCEQYLVSTNPNFYTDIVGVRKAYSLLSQQHCQLVAYFNFFHNAVLSQFFSILETGYHFRFASPRSHSQNFVFIPSTPADSIKSHQTARPTSSRISPFKECHKVASIFPALAHRHIHLKRHVWNPSSYQPK